MPIKTKEKRSPKSKRRHPDVLTVDLASILSVDHACDGCRPGEPCCCSTYEVCVTADELERIIPVLPEAARFCPQLDTGEGYDNIFDEVEPGLFAIDTDEDGLCLLAFRSKGRIRCSLHAAASSLGLSPEKVKPKACILWPMNFSEGKEVLSLVGDALAFHCTTPRKGRSRKLSHAFVEAAASVYGMDVGEWMEQEATKGALRTTVSRHR